MRTTIRRAISAFAIAAAGMGALAVSAPAHAQFRQVIANDMSRCRGGEPAVRVNIAGVASSRGTVRVQLYRGIASDWLESGRWLYRIEAPARQGTMSFCLPAPQPGPYGVAVRHDVNNNGSTDLRSDGGAMSNNPSINIFNLGKPSYRKTRFDIGNTVTTININMRYM